MKNIIYCFHVTLILFGNILMAAESITISPFSTDGCSMFPDGTLEDKTLWQKCCVEHDKRYWRGGTYDERKAADGQLKQCVASVGKPKIAALMLAGVRMGGSPYWPTPFRWGYGWPYMRGYKALTKAELAAVEAMAYSLEPSFYQRDNVSEMKNAPILTPALKLVDNYGQYQIALISIDKGQEYCYITDVYKGKNEFVINFKYRGETRLTLNQFDEKKAIAVGSYPISLPIIGTSSVDVHLKFNPDGTANGYWANLGFEDKFNIIKKKPVPVLLKVLDQLVENFSQYRIALVSLDKGLEYCDIVSTRRNKMDIVIKFRYRGYTQLTLTDFDDKNAVASGSYPISLPIFGTSSVHVDLKFNTNGTADGYWANLGFEDKFNIIRKSGL